MKLKIRFLSSAILGIFLSTTMIVSAAEIPPQLRLPKVIDSNMVLQRGMAVPIWGWAVPSAKISVQFDGQTKTAIADPNGRWEVRLHSMHANATAQTMTITGENETQTLTNVLVGEVWLCSGQSNMEKPIGKNGGQRPTVNAEKELASGDQFSNIRLFKVKKLRSDVPLPDVKVDCDWTTCSSNALEKYKFSAVGYFFGRKINRDVNVPVGLIESSWGGTMIEPWTPLEAIKSIKTISNLAIIPAGDTNLMAPPRPAAIYNAMIIPLAPYAIRGALWYQGEGNVRQHDEIKLYTDKMDALISGWRKLWGEGNFSFYYVQLAPYKYSGRSVFGANTETLAEMWNAQTLALRIPKTGMAVVNDTVDVYTDIHPIRKVEVGERLALIALAKDYHKKVESSGPIFKSVRFSKVEATLTFDHAKGLTTSDSKPPTWFQIARADGKFEDATALISGTKVIVSSPNVLDPKYVRAGWNELANPNLVNAAGLPLRPFTTSN